MTWIKTMTLYKDDEEMGTIRTRLDIREPSKILTKELPGISWQDDHDEIKEGLESELMGHGSIYHTEHHSYELMG